MTEHEAMEELEDKLQYALLNECCAIMVSTEALRLLLERATRPHD